MFGRLTAVILALAWVYVEPCRGQATPPAGLTLSAYTGGVAFSDWQGVWIAPLDGSAGSTSARTSGALAPSPAAIMGLGLTWWSRRGWGLRLEGAYAPSRLEVRLDAPMREGLSAQEAPRGPPTFGDVGVWTASGLALFRLPIALGPILPYGRVGIALIRDHISDVTNSVSSAELTMDGMRVGGDIGLGARVPLRRSDLGLYFEISDLFSRTPIDAAPSGEVLRSDALVVERAQAASEGAPTRVRMTNQLRIVAGLSLRLIRH